MQPGCGWCTRLYGQTNTIIHIDRREAKLDAGLASCLDELVLRGGDIRRGAGLPLKLLLARRELAPLRGLDADVAPLHPHPPVLQPQGLAHLLAELYLRGSGEVHCDTACGVRHLSRRDALLVGLAGGLGNLQVEGQAAGVGHDAGDLAELRLLQLHRVFQRRVLVRDPGLVALAARHGAPRHGLGALAPDIRLEVQRELRCLDVLLQLGHLVRAEDRHHVAVAREQPGQGELRARALLLLGDGLEAVH
mmetsp:Transcript_103472/g.275254  ORF Transcript_103472/g.275254 Transcript_103472/m.275254 type:complete len:249 (-) Transcript_103472:792-1538(-)